MTTVRRLYELALEMDVKSVHYGLVLNRTLDADCLAKARQLFQSTPVRVLGQLPEDDGITQQDKNGSSIFDLLPMNSAYQQASQIMNLMKSSGN